MFYLDFLRPIRTAEYIGHSLALLSDMASGRVTSFLRHFVEVSK